jgi:chemotaxis protein histidine kinase CheA
LVNDVFTHLLRNSIDHGIESPDERVSLGKKPEGTIRLDVSHHELGIQLSISDDGRGINLKRIKEKALESGKLSEADGKDPQKVANCLFLSGLSTAEKITAISGRGVGMDAVKKYLEQNNCAISIELSDLATASTEGYAPFSLKLILNNNTARYIGTYPTVL